MKRRFTSQVLGGLLLIGLGGMFLLRQMGYTDFSLGSLISTYWPVILIVMGVQRFWPRMRSVQDSLQHSADLYIWRSVCFSWDGI